MYTYERLENPTRIVALDSGEWVATFTPRCYSVTLAGPARTFAETTISNGASHRVEVEHATWVRAAPGPVDARIDERWLDLALAANYSNVPDALALAMQYIKGAPALLEGDLQIAGDASYGPFDKDGHREEGSDFNDYLGLPWLYPTEPVDRPELRQKGCLDCSGFMRMIWGYRHHLPGSGYPGSIPLSVDPRTGSSMPRRSFQIYVDAPGLVTVPNNGTQVTDVDAVEIGDLVFFDASSDDGTQLDHVGMFLGRDADGRYRFISSRKTADGPTLSDKGGASLLDGSGLFAKAFRAVRRL
jgi:cell wall-associated NlpC family hydrolase